MNDFALSDIEDIQRIDSVPKILDSVGRITGMGFVAIARVTSKQWVCCAVRDTIAFGLKEGGELRVETTICNEIRDHRQTVVIDDVATDGTFCDHPTPKMYGFRSYISAPIQLRDGTIWGTLCAIDPEPRKLDRPEIVNSFQLFGELISSQLELHGRLARSQAELGTSQANLRASETGLLSVQADLDSSRADLAGERKTSELREQFIGVLGHDLRNPLAAMDAGLRILSKNLDTGRGLEFIAMLQKSVLRMAGLVDNIMDFARGRLGGGLTLKRDAKEPLTPVIQLVVSEMRLAWPDADIRETIAIDEPVDCDGGKIGQLLSNLLGNAVTHGEKGCPILVSARTVEGSLVLAVANHGLPISERAMKHLFEPYTRGDRPSQQGLGLGLFIASEIARAHGGTLNVVSTAGTTTFEFRMPLV